MVGCGARITCCNSQTQCSRWARRLRMRSRVSSAKALNNWFGLSMIRCDRGQEQTNALLDLLSHAAKDTHLFLVISLRVRWIVKAPMLLPGCALKRRTRLEGV